MSIDKTVVLDAHPDETLTDNLTGGQIQEVLDTLINAAVGPIIRGSSAFDLQVIHLLSCTARNRKRKLSSLPREVSIDTMCQYLVSSNADDKVRHVAAMRLERGFIYNFVVRFLKETHGYVELYKEWLQTKKKSERKLKRVRLQVIESSVGCSDDKLFQVITSSHDYLHLAYKFRNTVVLNYLRHAFKQARSYVRMKGPNFDIQDVYQNFLAAVTKAVDKYDASKGALTSYINFWLLNAQTTSNSNHGHEYGVAYSIPQLQKKALAEKSIAGKNVNFGISLDRMVSGNGDNDEQKELVQIIAGDESVAEHLLAEEELDVVRSLIKHADPSGIARLYLDIDEVFSDKEKKRMLRTMREQLNVMPVKERGGKIKFVKVTGKTQQAGKAGQ